jgi:hypothetical protein
MGDPLPADGSSPITSYTGEEQAGSPRKRGVLNSLCSRLCCGRPADGLPGAQLAPGSRTVYVPPPPHTGSAFLPPQSEQDADKKTLVLDLDETLVHSSFKSVPNPDFVIPVEIDGKVWSARSMSVCSVHTSSPALAR